MFEPARGSTGPGTAPVLATVGGPNFTTGPAAGQTFPLLQTTLVLDSTTIKPDLAVNAVGGTATVAAGELTLDIAGFNDMPTVSFFPASASSNLDWTRVGYWSTGGVWDYWEDLVRHRGVFVAGYETAAGAMPTTGSATYTGRAEGSAYFGNGSGFTPCSCDEVPVSGTAVFTANFGTRSLTGTLTGMTAPHPWYDGFVPWNDVAFSATISGNGFSGDTRVTNSPNTTWAVMGTNATGTLEGKFFGPTAQEAAAVWTLFDGTNSAIGTLTGKRP